MKMLRDESQARRWCGNLREIAEHRIETMFDVKSKKGEELTRQLLELCGRIVEILPLGDPEGSFDWEEVRWKILPRDKTFELLKLAQEIHRIREELDNL
jgi:hypothetical protein